MVRKTTGRILSLALAAVVAMSSYVPSYAEEYSDLTTEEAVTSGSAADEETIQNQNVSETYPDSAEETLDDELLYDKEAVSVPIYYHGDIAFSDPNNQPPTYVEWNGEWLESDDIIVPFPDIPQGYELESMWAVFKSANGYVNIPASRNDETSTYTFTFNYYDSMDIDAGITVGADFTRIYDENDPDAELEIPIRYSLNYQFPADMPKSVKGKEGQLVYFILPYPEIPEGYELNYLRCMAQSYGFDALYGRIINDHTAYLYEYTVSREDVSSGISVFPEFERIIDAVFEDGNHGHHVFLDGIEKTFHLQEFFVGFVLYPGHGLFTPYYYVPDHGYDLTGLYYSQEMNEDCELYMPGQDGGTPIEEKMLSEDGKLHVYAKWEPITAQIRLLFDDYSSDYSVTYGDILPDFSRSSYSSYYVQNGSEKVEVIPGESRFDENIRYSCESDPVTGLTTQFYFNVYAEKSSFRTVSFDTGLEEVTIQDLRVRSGETVARPDAELKKAGYYLSGWYTDVEYKNIFSFGKTKITRDTTLYAKWVPVEYVVTYHSNFGKDETSKAAYRITEKDDEKNAAAVTANLVFSTLSDKTGFCGWESTDDFEVSSETTGKELIGKLVEKYGAPSARVSLDLYAQWEEAGNNYTVILDSNLPDDAKAENLGGSLADAARAENRENPYVKLLAGVDESFILTGDEYNLKGFTLSGWEYTNLSGRKVTLKPSASFRNLTDAGSEITARALWKKVSSYKITYKLNGGTAGKNKTTVTYSASDVTKDGVALYNYKKDGAGSYVKKDPKNNPEEIYEVSRTGYDFAGWTVGADFYTHYGDDIYQNLTLTAVWTPKAYTLKFMDTDGQTELLPEEAASFDSSFALKNYVPQKAGYTFRGWEGEYRNKTRLFTVKNTLRLKDLDMPASSDYVLTARFAAASYRISYSLDGGKIGSKPTSYVYGQGSAKQVPDPKKDGFEFAGWTAVVTDGDDRKEYTTGGIDENSISRVIDPGTGRVTGEICGNIELTANWSPYTYDVIFCREDGSAYNSDSNVLRDYAGLTFTESVDFTAAAMYIESLDDFDEGRSVSGFGLAVNARKPKYALYRKYSKLAAKSGSGSVIKVYPVLTAKTERLKYTVTLMPNAKDVRTSEDAGEYIDSSKGVQYISVDSAGQEISEFAYDTTASFTAPEWKRYGYELAGFGISPRSKVPVTGIDGLGNGKQTSVKLYAIWKSRQNTITYSKNAHVYNPFYGYRFLEDPSFEGEEIQTYKGKDVTLKTLSYEGYVFKGWQVSQAFGDGFISTYPSLDTGLIKKVLKDNCSDLVLEAVFDWSEYTIAFNPNGGTYEGKKKSGELYKVGYFHDVSDILEEFCRKSAKEGYVLSGLATDKKGKNMIELYDSNGERQNISKLVKKNGATITIYPIWTKVSPGVPAAGAALTDHEDGTVSLEVALAVKDSSETGNMVIEYSASPLFIFGVNSVVLGPENLSNDGSGLSRAVVSKSGLKNRTYYVRAKYGVKDSAGKYVYGKYTKTVRAARFAN